ncbi:MAG: FtsW/RodA/SpoVE family cell cycle protein [Armatimonadota bacterium]
MRTREILLLLLVFVILGLGYIVVWQSFLPVWRAQFGGDDRQLFLPPLLMLIAWLLVSVALARRRCRETLLLPVVALLTGLGLLFLLRLAGGTLMYANAERGADLLRLYQKQLMSFGVGWAALMGLLLFWKDYRGLARYKYVVALTAIGLLLITTLFGHAVHSQTLTLRLGALAFQPHDPVKLLMVIFLAAYLVEKRELLSIAAGRFGWFTVRDFRYMGPLVALWLLVMVIILRHNDLGAALLLFGSFLAILYLGTERKSYLLVGVVLFAVGITGAYAISGRVQTRVAIWQNPLQDPDGKGYQIGQSLLALASGRLVGAGLAGGAPERIPAIHTDMIYAGISEDLGLLGAVAVIGLFAVLIGRIFHVALRADDPFGQLLAAGLGATLAVQTFVILAGTINLIPLTGIPVPFMSYGGTSLVINMILLALVFKVAEQPKESGR